MIGQGLMALFTFSNIAIGVMIILTGVMIAVGVFAYTMRSKFFSMKPQTLEFAKPFIPEDYNFEVEKVKTRDGYILQVFKMSHKEKRNENLRPVVFHHGLGNSGLTWLAPGEVKAPPLIIARQGYTVYLLNSRGSFYGLEHENLGIHSEEFWKFSIEELKYDVEAVVNHVQNDSNGKKMHYISTSNGCSAYLAALTDPEKSWRATADDITSKIHLGYLLSPVVFTKGSEAGNSLNQLSMAKSIFSRIGVWSFPVDLISEEKKQLWNSEEYHRKNHAFPECERTNEKNDLSVYGTIKSVDPAGFSIYNGENYYQNLANDRFAKYDYGAETNLQRYGSAEPPHFDFTLARGRLNIYYGDSDLLNSSAGIHRLERALVNGDSRVVFNPGFGHVTYIMGIDNVQFFGGLLEE